MNIRLTLIYRERAFNVLKYATLMCCHYVCAALGFFLAYAWGAAVANDMPIRATLRALAVLAYLVVAEECRKAAIEVRP